MIEAEDIKRTADEFGHSDGPFLLVNENGYELVKLAVGYRKTDDGEYYYGQRIVLTKDLK